MTPPVKENYYCLLLLEPGASIQDVKKSYRKLVLEYHPDKTGGDPKLTEHFRKITTAYQVLSNEDRKREYDEGSPLYDDITQSEFYSNANYFMQKLFRFVTENHTASGSIFDAFLNNLHTHPEPRSKNSTTSFTIKASLEDIYRAKVYTIKYKVVRQPVSKWKNTRTCLLCDGYKRVMNYKDNTWEDCALCGATGHGVKIPLDEEILTLDIPLYRKYVLFSQMGNQPEDAPPGDIAVSIVAKDMPEGWEIKGYDLLIHIPEFLDDYTTVNVFDKEYRIWLDDIDDGECRFPGDGLLICPDDKRRGDLIFRLV